MESLTVGLYMDILIRRFDERSIEIYLNVSRNSASRASSWRISYKNP